MIITFETTEEQESWSQPEHIDELEKLRDLIVSMGITDVKTEYPK